MNKFHDSEFLELFMAEEQKVKEEINKLPQAVHASATLVWPSSDRSKSRDEESTSPKNLMY